MTPDERHLVEAVYARGADAFTESDLDDAAAQAFLMRKDVQDYLTTIDLEASDQEVLVGRARYAAKRALVRMMPTALQVLADSLQGPQYVRSDDGAVAFDQRGNPLIAELPPTMGMREAAAQVLDRLGVGPKQATEATGSVTVAALLHQTGRAQAEIDYGPLRAPEQRVIMRENLRLILERVALTVLPEASADLERKLRNPRKAMRDARRAKPPVVAMEDVHDEHQSDRGRGGDDARDRRLQPGDSRRRRPSRRARPAPDAPADAAGTTELALRPAPRRGGTPAADVGRPSPARDPHGGEHAPVEEWEGEESGEPQSEEGQE